MIVLISDETLRRGNFLTVHRSGRDLSFREGDFVETKDGVFEPGEVKMMLEMRVYIESGHKEPRNWATRCVSLRRPSAMTSWKNVIGVTDQEPDYNVIRDYGLRRSRELVKI